MAVYSSNCPFRMFNSDEWKAFFKVLGYAPSTPDILSIILLDNCYIVVESEVKLVLKESSKL
jgi:hypothetical protein